MCGIVGMFGVEQPRVLERMLDVTVHRGEDSTRFEFWDEHCGLGINRLSIVDLERGDQPLHDEAGNVHVVCNGEIFAGYLALRELRFTELHDAAWNLLTNLHKTELQRLDRMTDRFFI